MRPILTIFLLLCVSVPGLAQQKIDSLKEALKKSKPPERFDVLAHLAYEYIDVDNGVALRYALPAYNGAKLLKDTARIMYAGMYLTSALRRLEKMDSASLIYEELTPIVTAKRDTQELARMFRWHGWILHTQGKYDRALDLLFKSVDYAQHVDDKLYFHTTLNTLGILYYKMKDYNKALAYFYQSIDFQPRHYLDSQHVKIVKLNISSAYAYLGKLDDATTYFESVRRECEGTNCTKLMTQMAFNEGLIAFKRRQLGEAERIFLRAYEFSSEAHDTRFMLDNIYYLAMINLQANRPAVAMTWLRKGERLLESTNAYRLEQTNIYRQFMLTFEQMGDFKSMARYAKKYIAVRDSIYDESLTASLMKVEAAYREKENLATIKEQQEVLTLRQDVIDRQFKINMLSGALIVTLIGIVAALVYINKQRRSINNQLDARVKERTAELEVNRTELLKACRERDLVMERTASQLAESIATMKGLQAIALKEESETTKRLAGDVNRLREGLDGTLSSLKKCTTMSQDM